MQLEPHYLLIVHYDFTNFPHLKILIKGTLTYNSWLTDELKAIISSIKDAMLDCVFRLLFLNLFIFILWGHFITTLLLVHTCMYVCMYVCMYIHLFIYLFI